MCNGCDAVLHVPVAYCHRCGSWDTRWQVVAGTGSLYSWTVVAHQVHPAYPVPYTVVLVELDDHPEARLVGQLPGRPALEAGQPDGGLVRPRVRRRRAAAVAPSHPLTR